MKYCWKIGGRTETNGGLLQKETENEYEISKIQRRTPVPVSFFKKKLQNMCFHVNFTIFSRTIFLYNTYGAYF